jgi:hypothetical protein
VPAEPENLDEATPWQEGDPEPIEKKIPAEEPEQTSAEAPPSQPMDDERPEQPGPDYIWVTGYWWWTDRTYMWVPGYWALPPRTSYVYVSGYWTYRGIRWIYVRGGWAKPNTTAIVVYPRPRQLLAAFVITAPIRIVRRHRSWRHYHALRAYRRAVRRRPHRRLKRSLGRPGRHRQVRCPPQLYKNYAGTRLIVYPPFPLSFLFSQLSTLFFFTWTPLCSYFFI